MLAKDARFEPDGSLLLTDVVIRPADESPPPAWKTLVATAPITADAARFRVVDGELSVELERPVVTVGHESDEYDYESLIKR